MQAAGQIYRQVLAVQPNQPDALHLLGVIASQMGKHEVAVEYMGRAIRLKGNAASFHNNLGEAYRALRRISEAVACYRRALELKPDFAEAHGNLGNALKDQGRLDEAVACYRRALVLKPDFAEAHANLGSALEERGDLKGAENSFRVALRHDPRFAFAHYKLAVLLGGRLPAKDLALQRRLLEEGAASVRKGIGRTRNDCCCISAWPKCWTRVASMPRPPRTSRGATLCNWPIGACAAGSTSRNSTGFSSPG